MHLPRTPRLFALSLFAAVALCATTTHLSAQQPYKILDKWKIGGDGGWDYLLADPPAHRLYVTRGPQVLVIDTNTGKQAGAIAGLHGTHGIALDTAGKFGYISDGGGNAVVVFDRSTLAIVATIPTGGQNPDGIVFEPLTGAAKTLPSLTPQRARSWPTSPSPANPNSPPSTAPAWSLTTSKTRAKSSASTPTRKPSPRLGPSPAAKAPAVWPLT
jgi:DNA-binding beta-propeller fold protein YncE